MLFPIDISSAKAQKSLSYVNMKKHCYFMGCEPFVLQANRAKAKRHFPHKNETQKNRILVPKKKKRKSVFTWTRVWNNLQELGPR